MKFMKVFWAALLAFVVGGIVMSLIGFMFLASFATILGDEKPVVRSGSVLKIDFANGIIDSPSSSPFNIDVFGGVTFSRSNTILQALAAIEKASFDPNIEGIYIDLSAPAGVNRANLEELRSALEEFKEQGKFVVSYSDSYSQTGYYFASVADVVLLNPLGDLDWKGVSLSVMFYKGLLDKLDVNAEILRHGTFKSAVEPYMLTEMSPANRLQYTILADNIWDTVLDDVSKSRGISKEALSEYASGLYVRSAALAYEYGFVDALAYRDQAEWLVRKLAAGGSLDDNLSTLLNSAYLSATWEHSKDDKQEYVSLADYVSAGVYLGKKTSKNKVALIYADGTIVDGGDTDQYVVGTDVAAKIARARKDDKTKAVVLRVNSPGGSALASELIRREVALTRQVKPVIVSMGSMAASGGYWISCPADMIVADRMTLTGSIGVFGVMFDVSKTLKDKLGVTVDVVRTNPSADLGSPYRAMTQNERDAMMHMIEDIYTTFVNYVSDGRNMSFEEVDAIGEGRVWLGANALEVGLIDGFGGLRYALALAADAADISEDFRVWQVVDQADTFAALLGQLVTVGSNVVKDELGEVFMEYKAVREMMDNPGVKAMLPYNIVID